MLEQTASAVGIDLSHWPVIITSNAVNETDDSIAAQLAVLRRIYAERKSSYVTVIDASRGAPPSAKHRALLSAFRVEVAAHVKQHCRGVCFVFDSVVMRGIMTAMFWIRAADTPHAVFATRAEAIAWSKGQLFTTTPQPALK